MTALWSAGWIIMVACTVVLCGLTVVSDSEKAEDWLCVVDCFLLVALGCFAEGIIFGFSGIGVI